MTCKIVNKTDRDMSQFTQMAHDLYPYSQQRLGFDKPVMVELHSDPQNASNILGKTAYYNPSTFKIVVYTDNRHPKDILRSLSHELVHHAQNCRGEFDNHRSVGEGYAQANEHLRKMEKEAYLEGNMILRDWEDHKKTKKEKPKMDENKIREITRKILERLDEQRVEEDVIEENEWAYRRAEAECSHLGRDPQAQENCMNNTLKNMGMAEAVVEEEETLEEDHDCEAVHGNTPHAEWAQEQGIGPVAHMGVKENKSADQLHAQRLHEVLMKKWCK